MNLLTGASLLALAKSIYYFPFHRRSKNWAQVTKRASRGKAIVSIE